MLSLLHGVQGQRVADASDQSRAVQLRLGQTIPGSLFDDLGDGVFVGVLGENDERYGSPEVKEVGQKVNRLRVPVSCSKRITP